MRKFKQELYELLCIEAPSGAEAKVVDYVKPILEGLMDNVFLDSYGNLLAEKVVGDGNGATILLSAHMDTVSNIKKGRKVLFNNRTQEFRSSKGILGADDRAGIAIILAALRNVDKTSFSGKIQVAFCREEEIGCVGSSNIDVEWYKDAHLAIVVDRRGSRDIVTGSFTPWNFCSEAVGEFFENCSALLDMNWKSVGGGISDACTFSSNGVHSVNLSAGYENEHTDKEFVNIRYSKDTVNLILQAFSVINSQYQKFGEVPEQYSYYGSNSKYRYSRWDWEDEEEAYWTTGSATFYDKSDSWGKITGSTISGYVSLHQDGDGSRDNEVFIEEKTFRRMIDSYCRITGYNPFYKPTTKATGEDKENLESFLNALNKDDKDVSKHFTENANGELVLVK